MPEPRTSIFARREELARRPAPRFRWPTYLVTAPHAVSSALRDRHSRVPYDLWHARRPGSLQTACGKPAVTWQFFWTLDFFDAGTDACPECTRALVHYRTPESNEVG